MIVIDLHDIELDEMDVLEQLSVQDLRDELESRGKLPSGAYAAGLATGINDAIHLLKDAGIPKEVAGQLEEWARQPLADSMALKLWTEACGISAGRI